MDSCEVTSAMLRSAPGSPYAPAASRQPSGVTPRGWREAAGAYGEDGALRSVADVVSQETLLEVRAYKQSVKAAAKADTA